VRALSLALRWKLRPKSAIPESKESRYFDVVPFVILRFSLVRSFEMPDQRHCSFALIRFSHNTYKSGGVMAVVRGRSAAEEALRNFEWEQDDKDRQAGWRFFLEESDLEPGIDSTKATTLREAQLDRREAKSCALHSRQALVP
jgi:hypothetical protein